LAFDIHHHISNSTHISDLFIFAFAVFKNYNKPFPNTDSAINVDIYDNTYLINEYIDLGGIFRTRKKEWMVLPAWFPILLVSIRRQNAGGHLFRRSRTKETISLEKG
jgi:hypothetical protein